MNFCYKREREFDLNERPSGHEPDELTTALSHFFLFRFFCSFRYRNLLRLRSNHEKVYSSNTTIFSSIFICYAICYIIRNYCIQWFQKWNHLNEILSTLHSQNVTGDVCTEDRL